jgi:hypothetical protein
VSADANFDKRELIENWRRCELTRFVQAERILRISNWAGKVSRQVGGKPQGGSRQRGAQAGARRVANEDGGASET